MSESWNKDNYLFKENKKVNKLYKEIIKEEKLDESNRVYKYRVVLDQNPGKHWRISGGEAKFKTEAEAQEVADAWTARRSAKAIADGVTFRVEEIQDKPRKAKAKASEDFENPFKVGDIIYGSIGYSMTIPMWFEITKVTPKTITGVELNKETTDHDGYGQSGYCIPSKGSYRTYGPDHKEHTVRFVVEEEGRNKDGSIKYSAKGRLNGNYTHWFHLWDGEEKPFDYYD